LFLVRSSVIAGDQEAAIHRRTLGKS